MSHYLLAVIGAGEGAVPILKRAKELDYVQTISFGLSDSLGKDISDIFVEADIFDIDRIVSICREYRVSGVIATSESTTEVTALVAAHLGLPGNDTANGFGAKNKYIMRQRVSAVSAVKQPSFSLYDENTDYVFPVVVKAVDSCGKRGISIAKDRIQLKTSVEFARSYSSTGEVLIEEYIDGGREFSVECLAGNGYSQVIQITEKETSGPPHFTEISHHQPANVPDLIRKGIIKAAIDVLSVLGIKCGLAHLELKVKDGIIYFIELGARGGGDHIADTLTIKSTDFDYFKAAIDSCLGIYEYRDVHDVSFCGIYFHCKDNEPLAPLFRKAKTASWCIQYSINDDSFREASSNVETSSAGFFIYCSDHKITLSDA